MSLIDKKDKRMHHNTSYDNVYINSNHCSPSDKKYLSKLYFDNKNKPNHEDVRNPEPNNMKPSQRSLTYAIILLFTLNRSLNLVMYKSLTTFSYYFAKDFGIPYRMFSIVAIMNFPASLINVGIVPFYTSFRVDFVLVGFELILCASCFIVLGWHNMSGLIFLRFITGLAITAVRSEVNAMVSAFTKNDLRTRSISILELSFGISAAGFLLVGTSLTYLGWRGFFLLAALLILIMSIFIFLFVPHWYLYNRSVDIEIIQEEATIFSPSTSPQHKYENPYKYRKIHNNSTSNDTSDTPDNSMKTIVVKKDINESNSVYLTRREIFQQIFSNASYNLVFVSNICNKIARNTFYYTFSKWLYTCYDLNPTWAGFVTLAMALGHILGTSCNPLITKIFSEYGRCLVGSCLQSISLLPLPLSYIFNFSVPLYVASIMTFLFFFGCQIWYNNMLEISMNIDDRKILSPTVQTVFLCAGAGGGMIGTLSSTYLWEYKQQYAIGGFVCVCGMVLCIIVFTLRTINKYKMNQSVHQQPKAEDKTNEKEDIPLNLYTKTNYESITHDNNQYRTTNGNLPVVN